VEDGELTGGLGDSTREVLAHELLADEKMLAKGPAISTIRLKPEGGGLAGDLDESGRGLSVGDETAGEGLIGSATCSIVEWTGLGGVEGTTCEVEGSPISALCSGAEGIGLVGGLGDDTREVGDSTTSVTSSGAGEIGLVGRLRERLGDTTREIEGSTISATYSGVDGM